MLKVRGAQVGAVTELASAFGKSDMSSPSNNPSGWILSTSTLREREPELNTTVEQDEIRTAIWDTLMMKFPRAAADRRHASHPGESTINVFEFLWRPGGRGSVEDLSLIRWIDDNARFKIGPWTLRKWSQAKMDERLVYPYKPTVREDKSTKKFFSSKSNREKNIQEEAMETSKTPSALDLRVALEDLHRALSSGMRLVCIDFDEQCPVAVTHPDVEVGDKIFYLDGCSRPVVLRGSGTDGQDRVIGSCHLPVRISDEFVITKVTGYGMFPPRWNRKLDPIELVLI